MKMIALLAFFFSASAFAGASGYIMNGQTHVVFKDGKKIGAWPAKKDRTPSAQGIGNGANDRMIYYTDSDGGIRCFSLMEGNTGDDMVALSCVKL